MNNSNLEKPTKSMLWIVATIWANIIIIFLLVSIALIFLQPLLIENLDLGAHFVGIFTILLIIGATVFAIRLGIKTVVKKSIIEKKKIFKISFWTGLVDLFLRTGFLFFAYILLPYHRVILAGGEEAMTRRFLIIWIISFFISIGYFGITYFWSKKLIK